MRSKRPLERPRNRIAPAAKFLRHRFLAPGSAGAWRAAVRRLSVPCLLIAGALPWAAPVAQTGAGQAPPLVPQVAGNCYERVVRSADGRVTGHQRIRVRDPTMKARGAEARIDVVSFETGEGGELQVDERFSFQMIGDISRDAQKEEAALQIVGYVGSNSRVALDLLGDTTIYPAEPCTGQRLPPVALDLSASGGVVDLLGGRAEIRIADRTCTPTDEGSAATRPYVIDSTLRLKVYLLGIPFKKVRYASRQHVDPERGLVRHVLENRDGGTQELVLVDRSVCSPPWRPLADR